MPFALSSAWRRTSSWKLVLPPSMIVSPGSRCSSSSVDLGLGRVAGRDHDPDGARLLELAHELRDRERRRRALAGDLRGLLRRPVVDDDLVAVAEQPADHVGAHPAEPDEPDAHRGQASVTGGVAERRAASSARSRAASPASDVAPEVDSQDRQVVRLDGGEVAGRLGVDELAEGVRPARDRPVDGMVGGQLEEPADRRAALVELAGRVEEARAVAGGRRSAGRVAQERPDPGDRRIAAGVGAMNAWRREVGVRVAGRGGAASSPTTPPSRGQRSAASP